MAAVTSQWNTTNSGVRVAQISGIIIAIQDERSQHMALDKISFLSRTNKEVLGKGKLEIQATHYLGGANYVFWGGQEGYQTVEYGYEDSKTRRRDLAGILLNRGVNLDQIGKWSKGADSDELSAASKLGDQVNFYQTVNADVAKLFHIDPKAKHPALVLLTKEEEKLTYFDGELSTSRMAEFVAADKLPLVTTFTQESAQSI